MEYRIDQFVKPSYAASFLGGKIRRASEGEDILAWMLVDSVMEGELIWRKAYTKANKGYGIVAYDEAYVNLVNAGFLEQNGDQYRLTQAALELLHRHYGKVER